MKCKVLLITVGFECGWTSWHAIYKFHRTCQSYSLNWKNLLKLIKRLRNSLNFHQNVALHAQFKLYYVDVYEPRRWAAHSAHHSVNKMRKIIFFFIP